MATSARYNTLAGRINQLETHLLPAIDPTGSYTDKDQDMIRAYCLLSHAEIEAYIEDYSLEIINRAYNKWDLNKTIISNIVFHLAYNYKQESGKPKDLPYSMVVKSYNSLVKIIGKNNGIKEDNLDNFFKPIGFDIDPTLKSTLNDFGRTRGQIAHTSFQTQNSLDPLTEKNNLILILQGLKAFDKELDDYESTSVLNHTPVSMQWEKFSLIARLKILFTGRT